MPRITREELDKEIERAGKSAKLSSNTINHIKSSVEGKSRVSTFSISTTNGYKHPLVLAGIVDSHSYNVTDNKFVKTEAKVDKFIDAFGVGFGSQEPNKFVSVT